MWVLSTGDLIKYEVNEDVTMGPMGIREIWRALLKMLLSDLK